MLGAKGAAHLVECFGSAEAVYSASAGELVERAELNQRTARAIAAGAGMREAEREMAYCRRNGITPIGVSTSVIRRSCGSRPTIRPCCTHAAKQRLCGVRP